MTKSKNNTTLMVGIAIIVVLVAALAIAYSFTNYTPPAITTTTSLAAVTSTVPPTTSIATTTVNNVSTAGAPNFVACDGFNFSTAGSGSSMMGYCNWAGGLLNVTLYGGNFDNVAVHFNQVNTTSQPFLANYYAQPCTLNSTFGYAPRGNYDIVFTTGSVSRIGGTCGNATVRLEKT